MHYIVYFPEILPDKFKKPWETHSFWTATPKLSTSPCHAYGVSWRIRAEGYSPTPLVICLQPKAIHPN